MTTSVSGDVPLTCSLFSNLVQNFEKSCSLIKCQTDDRGASMTAASDTEAEVGMRVDMIKIQVVILCNSGEGENNVMAKGMLE